MRGIGERAQTDVAVRLLERLRVRIGGELHDYPYPIAGCDEVFKLLTLQRECCRIGLGGMRGEDGLTTADAADAMRDLLATPVALDAGEQAVLAAAVRALEQDVP